jgi:hypothetical protein
MKEGRTKRLHLTAARPFRSPVGKDLNTILALPPASPAAVGEAHRSA